MSNPKLVKSITDAIGAHGTWKMKLKTAINTSHFASTPDEVRCSDCCTFGKWLAGPEVDSETKNGVPYRVVRRLHAEFHDNAAKVVTEAMAGNRAGAIKLLESEYAASSEKLTRALFKWKGEVA